MGFNEHLFPEERRQEILKRVNFAGRVEVADLSQLFGVSEVTIRSDLQLLSDQSLVQRTHGGAVPISRIPDLSLSLRRQQQVNEKNRIGAAGAELVEDGDAIFLDTSSTALALANHLRERRDITVLTNSLAIAQILLEVAGTTVVMPGGTLQRETVSLVGTDGLEFLHKFNIRKGFFGAHGIRQPEGLTDVSATEAEVKRNLITQCHEVIAILDSTKWGRIGLASFARLEDIHSIITNTSASPEQVEQARALGIRVILV